MLILPHFLARRFEKPLVPRDGLADGKHVHGHSTPRARDLGPSQTIHWWIRDSSLREPVVWDGRPVRKHRLAPAPGERSTKEITEEKTCLQTTHLQMCIRLSWGWTTGLGEHWPESWRQKPQGPLHV